MIKNLRTKFIVLAMTSLLVLLVVIVTGMNLMNFKSVVSEADDTLLLMSQNQGRFPDFGDIQEDMDLLPPGMSPDLPFESRYFSVLLDEKGEIIYTDTSHIMSVSTTEATEYAGQVYDGNKKSGFVGVFRFIQTQDFDGRRITFLDCGRELDAFERFLISSIAMSVAGLILMFFVITFFAGKILRPVEESYYKQKRFITDAGHEIKTPLTIINTNADLLEMEIGENECVDDIKQQAKRLTSLTNDLVYLARMEEAENSIPAIDFPVSDIISDAALPFKSLAKAQGKQLNINIQPMLSMKGNDKAVERLISILMDNAVKYSPQGGSIELSFSHSGKNLMLTVTNDAMQKLDEKNMSQVFERFYRMDSSRNSETGGYGIGLSTAQAIVTAHGGKIQAGIKDGNRFQITVQLPV